MLELQDRVRIETGYRIVEEVATEELLAADGMTSYRLGSLDAKGNTITIGETMAYCARRQPKVFKVYVKSERPVQVENAEPGTEAYWALDSEYDTNDLAMQRAAEIIAS